jgi:hypothetical protein
MDACAQKIHSQEEKHAEEEGCRNRSDRPGTTRCARHAHRAMAQDATTPYEKMAPIEQYLMDCDAEIALARSTAPDAIAHDASVLVLTRHGYKTVAEGKNGWLCMVGRGWMAMFDNPEFWSPKVRAAGCFNAPAVHSILPETYKRTELVLAGHSKQEVIPALKAVIDKKELPPLDYRRVGQVGAPGRAVGLVEHRVGRIVAAIVLVHLRQGLPTTQNFPAVVCLDDRSRKMVRRGAGPTDVASDRRIFEDRIVRRRDIVSEYRNPLV